MSLIFATNNKHKLEEIVQLTEGIIEVKGLSQVGITEEIPETHETLVENAIEKATFIHQKYGFDCFADDTGLEIDALDGRPGVYSARYAGENCSFEDNVNKVLNELGDSHNRKARFRTVIALILNGKTYTFEGHVEGQIIKDKRGGMGFGYDPVFVPEGYGQSFAEMNLERKNKISHRARALQKFLTHLKEQG